MSRIFRDRRDAGRVLGRRLAPYRGRQVTVLALPRGGVPVAFEVARALDAPLDILVVRKLGVPGQEEVAMGAIASGGVRVLDQELIRHLDIPARLVEEVTAREAVELERREAAYRDHHPPAPVEDRIVILVDDGLATGATMAAAASALRPRRPLRIVAAVPVASREAVRVVAPYADEVVAALVPSQFLGVGRWYESFPQLTDAEVRQLLDQAAERRAA